MCDKTLQSATVQVQDAAGTLNTPSGELVQDLVTANHILFDQGVVDAFGHVSARHDKDPDRFLLSCNIAPGQVSAKDIVQFNLDGDPLDANGRKVYLERYIHSEIYRAWPDVMAIVHSHSHAIVPFTVLKKAPMQALFHMAGFVGTSVPVFEIRDVAGSATDLLIRDRMLGKSLATCFENSRIVLMRGHGSTVVADSLQKAVYRAVYADINARYQSTAMQLGEVTYLTDAECEASVDSTEGQVQRPWDLWKRQAERARATQ
jgi:HCOMODA/2-hydroxy-3-carboxy-muconic semialdehyde decarboxylase